VSGAARPSARPGSGCVARPPHPTETRCGSLPSTYAARPRDRVGARVGGLLCDLGGPAAPRGLPAAGRRGEVDDRTRAPQAVVGRRHRDAGRRHPASVGFERRPARARPAARRHGTGVRPAGGRPIGGHAGDAPGLGRSAVRGGRPALRAVGDPAPPGRGPRRVVLPRCGGRHRLDRRCRRSRRDLPVARARGWPRSSTPSRPRCASG
jgi:hypothetical protein